MHHSPTTEELLARIERLEKQHTPATWLMVAIEESLEEYEDVEIWDVSRDNIGPLGGRSHQVRGYFSLGDRRYPFACNIYVGPAGVSVEEKFPGEPPMERSR